VPASRLRLVAWKAKVADSSEPRVWGRRVVSRINALATALTEGFAEELAYRPRLCAAFSAAWDPVHIAAQQLLARGRVFRSARGDCRPAQPVRFILRNKVTR
jgi:hypothetical protein